MKTMDICIDFDGTCVTHDFPRIGKDIGAVPVLKKIVAAGHHLVLNTMRSNRLKKNPIGNDLIVDEKGMFLHEAIKWFMDNNIQLYGVKVNPSQSCWTTSVKVYADLYIDDAALGAPLKYNPEISDRPYIDWVLVEQLLEEMGVI